MSAINTVSMASILSTGTPSWQMHVRLIRALTEKDGISRNDLIKSCAKNGYPQPDTRHLLDLLLGKGFVSQRLVMTPDSVVVLHWVGEGVAR